jgi:hypothetical protein
MRNRPLIEALRLTTATALLLSAALLSGCSSCGDVLGFFVEPTPDIDNPKQYARGGITFSYPGNWNLTQSALAEAGISIDIIEISSQGNAYMAVQVFTPALPLELTEILDETTKVMHEEVSRMTGGLVRSDDGTTRDVSRQVLGAVRPGLERQVTIEVLGERTPHTIEVYGAEFAAISVVVISSAADEDLHKIGPGYALVLDSLAVVGQPPG